MPADQPVVDTGPDHRPGDGRGHGHPPPAAAGREHVPAPSRNGREEARTEVPRGVDRVAGVESKGDAKRHDERGHERRDHPSGRPGVALVGDRQHAAHQERRADELIDETAGNGQERLWIRREDAGRGRRPFDHPHAAVEGGEGLAVGDKHQRRREKRAGDLGRRKRQHFSPWKPAMHGERDRHRRVEVRARHARRHVDTQHHAEPPSEVDPQVGAIRALAEHGLRHHADAERDEDERAEQFRRRFTRCASQHARDYTRPCSAYNERSPQP